MVSSTGESQVRTATSRALPRKRIRRAPGDTSRRLLYGQTTLVYLFLFLPILVIVIASFNPAGTTAFPPTGVTAGWYNELAQDADILAALWQSLKIAVLTALITSTLALLAAYGLSRYNFRAKRAAQAFFYLPMLVPQVVAGIALVLWFNRINLETGLLTILIAHVIHALPFALTLILTSFYGFDRRLEEAAQDLGANEWRTFRDVTLPLVLPGVIGGALIAFTISFDEFVLTFFVAGSGVRTLPVEIYSRIRFMLSPAINAVATVVIVFSMITIFAGQVLGSLRRDEGSA